MGLMEMIERGYFPPKKIRRRLIAGLFFLIKFSIGNLGKIRSSGRSKLQEKRYVRPPRLFTIPEYQPGMKYCNLNQKYLRPTLYCNSHVPEIIALACHLGAYRKSDWEFAESAFEFVKRNIRIELISLDGVENTLRRGTGTCLHRVALLVALCRAAGIKTRYRLYSLTSMDTLNETIGDNLLDRQWNDRLESLMLHGEAEALIDEKWVVGSIGLTAERQASLNLPITRFGEASLGVWYSADPASIVQIESIPVGLNGLAKIVFRMVPAAIDKANANLLEQCNRGRVILEKKGEQAYDDEARRAFKPRVPEPIMKSRGEIIFKR
jgi:hypothetical protein